MAWGKRPRLALLACAPALMLLQLSGAPAQAAGPGGGTPPKPTTPYSGFAPSLARAPYVTDLTQTSAQVTWATTSSTPGSLRYGLTGGGCNQSSVAVPPPTSASMPAGDYQSSVRLSGLAAGATYCYQLFDSGGAPLLPPAQPSQSFTTLDPASISSTAPLTFDVVADFGESINRGAPYDPTANPVNTNQSAIDSLIGSSGARFAVAVGDIAYNDGSPSNYGDLVAKGTGTSTTCAQSTPPATCEVSNIFGPSYWPLTGGIPVFAAIGNHGQNSMTGINTWPELLSASEPGEVYGSATYSGVDGINTATYPAAWYAFTSGNARFYVLDSAWNDCAGCNFGTANGARCTVAPGSSTCKGYNVDADLHFAQSSAEYQWLAGDLHAHPGGLKFAFWHYPIRSDNATQESDLYLQQALEPLLVQNGVSIAFNGHAHDYERNTSVASNQLVSFVTGGGGGVAQPVGGYAKAPCSSWDAYAIGWDYTAGNGSHCGASSNGNASPTSDAQVYNFLKVTVQGNNVTVAATDATGTVFDVWQQAFNPPQPTAPANLGAAALSASSVQLTWGAASETGDYVASYQITRNSTPLTSVAAPRNYFVDKDLQPNTTAIYTVTAVDGAGNAGAPATAQATTPLFITGFESGNLAGWNRVSGNVSVQTQVTHASSGYAAGLSATAGQPPGSYAFQTLPASTNLFAQGWAFLPNASTTATLLGLRTNTSQIAQVYVSNGVVKVLDNISHASYLSNTTFPTGGWHAVTLQVNVSAGTMEVWLDGTPVPFNTPSGMVTVLTGQNLGSTPVTALQLGDDSTNRTYQWYADDLVVSAVQPSVAGPPSAPTAPSSVLATVSSASAVGVSWGASSEIGGSVPITS